DFLEQKLLLNQAKIDSIEVSESTVDLQLNQRLQYFIAQIGSEKEMEEYFGKSMLQIKEDLREVLREQLITQQMQGEITGDVKITPSEVKKFYNSLSADSIPSIDALVEVQQIVIYPPLGEDAVFDVKERMLDLRKRIMEGESFETLAILYSEDPGASNGGDIGFFAKGELDPEYAKEAFSLKEGGISKIVESEFGFHIIQLVERRDDRVRTRHILMKPKISLDARKKALSKLDSIANLIRYDSITFDNAARIYSQDKKTAVNKGLMVNPYDNSSKFELKQLETKDYIIARDLKVGEVSDPFESVDDKSKVVYKIIKLKSRTDPHKANLKQDYMLIQSMAMNEKKNKVIQDWIREKQKETYYRIDPSFKNCEFFQNSWNLY
ncbi:MAG: peptidylprolyl isomerase, partial [Bacteroidales bacterium]|nr:peptidylprolyl isomerase [Bacteroidales bacterium]